MGGFRILHTADSHIGADLPAKRTTRRRRGDDFVDSLRRVLAAGLGGRADLIIHAGDVFDRSSPTPSAMAAAETLLHEVAAAGVPIVIVPGNHERSRIPTSLMLAHPNIHIAHEPTTFVFSLRGRQAAIAAFPFVRHRPAEVFAEMVARTGWEAANAEVNILAVHQTFESATCGPANYRFRSGEDVVERDAVPKQFDYVAAGHIHRHQVLTSSDGVPIVYAGSPDRITFAEMHEPKGYVLIEECDGVIAHRFVEHDVRPMCIVPIDVSGMAQRELREHVAGLLAELPRDAIAQLRLTGNTNAAAVRGLRLTQIANDVRPDIEAGISFQAIELGGDVGGMNARAAGGAASAFDALDAPPRDIVIASPDDLTPLPARYGTYAFYDERGRLLYIGKSSNLRTRVRSHIRDGANGHFAGWTQQIARIEARPAESDAESLLVEADLVRRCKPPFNRQMRLWSRYWYLAERRGTPAAWEIVREPSAVRRCFGPFSSKTMARSVGEAVSTLFKTAWCDAAGGEAVCDRGDPCERFHARQCSGPCAGRVFEHTYRDDVAARDALLNGRGDSAVAEMEERVEVRRDAEGDSDELRQMERTSQMLRFAFNRQAMIRKAGALLGGLLVLPGENGDLAVGTMTPRGLSLERLANNNRDAARILAWHAKAVGVLPPINGCALPRTIVDCLCTAARLIDKQSEPITVLEAAQMRTIDADELRATAFDDKHATSAPAQSDGAAA